MLSSATVNDITIVEAMAKKAGVKLSAMMPKLVFRENGAVKAEGLDTLKETHVSMGEWWSSLYFHNPYYTRLYIFVLHRLSQTGSILIKPSRLRQFFLEIVVLEKPV